ncbi:SCO5918 family protein [Streptomyces sp. Je 1-79]|uniref:SCO5918 family protein n=1 Tax=Streptomyces sp. Je 1-79 TaxID=2943847 RepID=UPI0021A29987|nr:SCO5918 family protein [Streptomyces sp. Je 1-79]MCT4354737.1 SCO5918 family protein [Streptomyces sp. Je 1-79]
MRCVIARFPFELTKSGVLDSMKGVKPEEVTGESVIIGRRTYPVKQVGQVITSQDRRDFSADEVVRAMTRLGFTCRGPARPAAPARALDPLQHASALLGVPVGGPVGVPVGGPTV